MSTKKKILLIFGYIRRIEHTSNLFSIVPLPVTSVIHKFYTKISHRNISKDSIIDLYIFAQQLRDDNLIKIIWRWIGRKPKQISDPLIKIIFENQTSIDLAKLLQKDYISINEERIFTHSINWIKKQYIRNSANQLQPRDIIQPILKYIRFPLMSIQFLSNDVYHSGILTDKEFLGIIRAKYMKDDELTEFNMKKRKKARHKMANDDDNSDDGFDDENMKDIIDTDKYEEITDRIQGILNSGEYGGYPMQYMYTDDTNYWCSCHLNQKSKVWMVFDCKTYEIAKIEIKFQASYACSVIKVYSSDTKGGYDWDRITKKINMPKNGSVHKIRVKQNYTRFIKLKFEDWINGYVGVERIRFYQRQNVNT